MPSWKLPWSKVSNSMTNVLLKKTVTGNVIKREFSINNGLKVAYKKTSAFGGFFYDFKYDYLVAQASGQYTHQTRMQFLNHLQAGSTLLAHYPTGSLNPKSSTSGSDP